MTMTSTALKSAFACFGMSFPFTSSVARWAATAQWCLESLYGLQSNTSDTRCRACRPVFGGLSLTSFQTFWKKSTNGLTQSNRFSIAFFNSFAENDKRRIVLGTSACSASKCERMVFSV
jgi:hypothetical protein